MSPRRRMVVVLAVVLAAGLAVLAAVVALRSPDRPHRTVPQDRPGPVLLVPGYGGGTGALQALRGALDDGRQVLIVPTVGNGTGDLRVQARQVQRAAAELVAGGAPSVDVVGYSAGGVVARIWVAEEGGDRLARRVVTVGSPHRGTTVAQLGAVLAPQSCPVACQQLVPGSDLLSRLPETPPGPRWTSVWTARDEVVTPPESGRLHGAVDIRLQGVCADDSSGHGQLPGDTLVVGIVLAALAVEPLTAAPQPSQCAALRAAGSARLGPR